MKNLSSFYHTLKSTFCRKSIQRKLTILLLTIIIFTIFCLGFYKNGVRSFQGLFLNHIALEKMYYLSQIFVSIFVMIGGLIAVWQYSLVSKSERVKMDVDTIQRAVDLSRFYKDAVLPKISAVRFILEESGLMEILSKIDRSKVYHFDYPELTALFPKTLIQEYDKLKNGEKFTQACIQAQAIYGNIINFQILPLINRADIIPPEDGGKSSNYYAVKYMGKLIAELLNDLEYFAMHFYRHTANDTVVYQSLHQTYLDIVYMLYYPVAKYNKNTPSKYYTNVIWLYQNWNARKETHVQENRKGTDLGDVVSFDID